MRSDIGLRRFILDFDLAGIPVGVEVRELPVSLSLMPLSSDVWDLEKVE